MLSCKTRRVGGEKHAKQKINNAQQGVAGVSSFVLKLQNRKRYFYSPDHSDSVEDRPSGTLVPVGPRCFEPWLSWLETVASVVPRLELVAQPKKRVEFKISDQTGRQRLNREKKTSTKIQRAGPPE